MERVLVYLYYFFLFLLGADVFSVVFIRIPPDGARKKSAEHTLCGFLFQLLSHASITNHHARNLRLRAASDFFLRLTLGFS
ncbi:hypothetical protein HMPREF1153_2383 [Selenomonas sp. CM52]|nr:hypothetical protein HMPREF1153_2383 [Selenomonas sp. CM52]